ncbi:phospholactate guanylyltransferase [Halovivax asiaticus JCM 14624]|uniref:2-phospho-L-lactate guanylyltransferase n=1 Tax=Halovivax asiaticus JCM 14624 TaxID=1227490 RepID=M0BSC8_9EURY|nr:2-phospho-L-lactate guanylyltransferase [Halovivax asiaticus]ELZ13916.1 phospholactate guanylyltransferase [Halovivax asiaticus JCM 14624]
MQVFVPFAADAPKTRLSSALAADERRHFARTMLRDVVDAVAETGHDPRVLATGPVSVDVPVTVDERSLDAAVNDLLESHFDASGDDDPIAVVMADLALATVTALDRLFEANGDVVFAPGRGGGTNAFVTRHPDFRVDYHGTSYLDHRAIASSVDATLGVVDSFRLATDVDEPADLVEVLCHGDGRTREFLVEAGFELVTADEGRVTVSRTGRVG